MGKIPVSGLRASRLTSETEMESFDNLEGTIFMSASAPLQQGLGVGGGGGLSENPHPENKKRDYGEAGRGGVKRDRQRQRDRQKRQTETDTERHRETKERIIDHFDASLRRSALRKYSHMTASRWPAATV